MKWYCYNIRQLTDAEYQKWYDLADGNKQTRIDRFRLTDDKKRSIAGEMLARKAISDWSGISPESIVFDRNPSGKPLAQNLPVEFNISHSGELVVCAVDSDPIGIDVERIRKIDWPLVERVCTGEELSYVRGGADHASPAPAQETLNQEQLVRFFEIWTAKEAYFKWLGTGITDLKSTDVLPHVKNGGCVYRDSYVISIYQ